MDEEQYNSQIKKIGNMMMDDSVSTDEQDQDKLKKYKDQTISDCNQSGCDAIKLVYEALSKIKKF